MKHLTTYKIYEKAWHSEDIRNKYYSDMPKRLFYMFVNSDPTSVRKKDFSKVGKYVKWLINQYNQHHEDSYYMSEFVYRDDIREKIKNSLYIFTTSTGRKLLKDDKEPIDIHKHNIDSLLRAVSNIKDQWTVLTNDGKIDLVYEDNNLLILIPLNFTACYQYSKNTEWCSQSLNGYNSWSKQGLLYRFIDKQTNEIYRLTWMFNDNTKFSWATKKYPEIGYSNFKIELKTPFEFDKMTKNFDSYGGNSEDRFMTLKEFWKKFTTQAISNCIEYYNKSK